MAPAGANRNREQGPAQRCGDDQKSSLCAADVNEYGKGGTEVPPSLPPLFLLLELKDFLFSRLLGGFVFHVSPDRQHSYRCHDGSDAQLKLPALQ